LQIVILEAIEIGDIPMALGYQLGLIEDSKSDELASNASLDSIGSNKKSRKRRSGSLTRNLIQWLHNERIVFQISSQECLMD
jgi:hypothetical protein